MICYDGSFFDDLYYLLIKPHEDHWRELMLELGAPLNVEWQISVAVSVSRLSDDVPYDVSEMVSIQDYSRWWSGEEIGATEVSKSDLEVFAPNYVSRTRIFLFDHMPARDEIQPISPMFPAMPFIEIKHHSIEIWKPGDPTPGSISFHFEPVPPSERGAQFMRHLRWWESLSNKIGLNNHQQAQHELLKRSRGGANNKRKYLEAEDDLKAFALKVDELRPHWQKIKDWFGEQDYDGGCVKAIQGLDWFQTLCVQWRGVPESVLRLMLERREEQDRRKTWPYAFALEHARILFSVKPLGYDRLDELYKEGKKLLLAE
jgi:hypothetical protein